MLLCYSIARVWRHDVIFRGIMLLLLSWAPQGHIYVITDDQYPGEFIINMF